MKYSIYIITALMLTSCQTERGAVKKILKLHAVQPAATAEACAGLYPPLEYTRDSIVYKPGAVSELVYVYADCDTVTDKRAGKLKIPCPPMRVTDTIFLYKEKQVVNRAEVEKLTMNITDCNEANAVLTKEKSILIWVALIFVAYTLLRWVLRVWRIDFP